MPIQMIEIPLIDGWGEKIVKQFSPSELVNFYIDINNAKEPALISTPGLNPSSKKTLGLGSSSTLGVRQIYTSELTPNMHLIVGNYIYQLDPSLTPIFGRYITTESGNANIEAGNGQIMFTDGVASYIYDMTTGGYSLITSPNAPPKPGSISVLAGRFLVNELDSDKLHISDINDGMSWQGNVITLSSYPERIIAHGTIRGRLFLLGTRCGEVWYLSDTYPYVARDNNLLLEYGCAARGSLAIGEDRMCWLAKDKQGVNSVVVTNGGMPQKISSNEIEAEFQAYDDVSDAQAFIYKNAGIIFYQINFTAANKSFLYNFNTDSWSNLQSGENKRHLASCHAFYNGKHYMGSYISPDIFYVDNYYGFDNTTPIKRKFVTRVMYAATKFVVHSIRVIMQQATGISSPNMDNDAYNNDIEPKLFLRVSRDNGIVFGNALQGDIGKIGKRETICDFYRLGYFDYGSIVLDFEHYSHTPCNILKILMFYSKQ